MSDLNQQNAPQLKYKFDAFLSHSSLDKPIVRALAERLRDDGLKVWFDEWCIDPGQSIPLKVEQGLESSRTLVLCQSKNESDSDWVAVERMTPLFQSPKNEDQHFIPLKLDDAPTSKLMSQFKYIDWSEQGEPEYQSLLTILQKQRDAELKPAVEAQAAATAAQAKLAEALDPSLDAAEITGLDKRSPPTRPVLAPGVRSLGHTAAINSVAFSPDGKLAISGSDDNTCRIWNIKDGTCTNTLEAHTGYVTSVAFSPDGKHCFSAAYNGVLRIWDVQTGEAAAASEPSKYTNAKVLLVGETGVGKSGLAIRLTENKFEKTESTDGHWATQLSLPHELDDEETEREIWLWDFAGQADYRLIHQLFMDETALAVLVFNPQDDNPYDGLGQWSHDLERSARRKFAKLLVAGRVDRGGLTVSRTAIGNYAERKNYVEFFETSAKTGEGCDGLRAAIAAQIDWNSIPHTSSPRIFHLLKEQILALRDEGFVLMRMSELKQQMEMRINDESFTLAQLRAVVGLLAGPGHVWRLEFGDFILLQPERINSYAAAVIRKVRKHRDEIGCINAQDVLTGDLDFQDMQRLDPDDEAIVLQAMHHTFIDRGLCLRQPVDSGTQLVFPSYFSREREELKSHPAILVTYQFSGMLDEIYATLIVRLHLSSTFDTDKLWRFAADFKTPTEQRLGLIMDKKQEGNAEITVFFEPNVAEDTRVIFIKYVHEHLKSHDPEVKRIRHYVCPHCDEPFENRRAIDVRLLKGHKDIMCPVCEDRFSLIDTIEQKFASAETLETVRDMEAIAKHKIEVESNELVLLSHAMATAVECGHFFRPVTNIDGIDGEIEFRDWSGNLSGKKVLLQLRPDKYYTIEEQSRDARAATVVTPNDQVAFERWQKHENAYVLTKVNDEIQWADISAPARLTEASFGETIQGLLFRLNPMTAQSLQAVRDHLVPIPETN